MSYDRFIKEAFLDPIRSVLMIDDDYPTYDEMLASPMDNRRETYRRKLQARDPDSLRRVIRNFRERPTPLLVDIHDGTNVTIDNETKVASHLHQTDLLILDYVLDRSLPEDGAKAIKILRSLMQNNHFNLVVVYTNIDLDEVFDSVRIGVLGPLEIDVRQEDKVLAEKLIGIEERNDQNFYQKLQESVDTAQYLYSRKCDKYQRTMGQRKEPFRFFL